MKKSIILLLLAVYLLSATELHQLLRLPVLVVHFFEHKQEQPDLLLWQYIKIHYAAEVVVDADFERDMQLPFKSVLHGGTSTVAAIVAPVYPFVALPFNQHRETFIERPVHFTSAAHLSAIWNPPKSC